VTLGGNVSDVDVFATNTEQTRTVSIQVKAKSGTSSGWQTSIERGQETPVRNDSRFWILVDLGDLASSPSYFVVPEWWMQQDIYEAHHKYTAEHGGHRARNDASTHHLIQPRRVEEWRDRWNLLGIFAPGTAKVE
jgi:hypothetical protein